MFENDKFLRENDKPIAYLLDNFKSTTHPLLYIININRIVK